MQDVQAASARRYPTALRCRSCKHELRMPFPPLSAAAVDILVEAFVALHRGYQDCFAGDGQCPERDPGCDQPPDKDGEAPHCHDACKAPPDTLVNLLVQRGGDIFDAGDGWQCASDVEDFLRVLAEVAWREGCAS